jgi:hypothetical protein
MSPTRASACPFTQGSDRGPSGERRPRIYDFGAFCWTRHRAPNPHRRSQPRVEKSRSPTRSAIARPVVWPSVIVWLFQRGCGVISQRGRHAGDGRVDTVESGHRAIASSTSVTSTRVASTASAWVVLHSQPADECRHSTVPASPVRRRVHREVASHLRRGQLRRAPLAPLSRCGRGPRLDLRTRAPARSCRASQWPGLARSVSDDHGLLCERL